MAGNGRYRMALLQLNSMSEKHTQRPRQIKKDIEKEKEYS